MTEHELRTLQPGDIVQSVEKTTFYVIMRQYSNQVTLLCTIAPTQAHEWDLVARARYSPHEGRKGEGARDA